MLRGTLEIAMRGTLSQPPVLDVCFEGMRAAGLAILVWSPHASAGDPVFYLGDMESNVGRPQRAQKETREQPLDSPERVASGR